jgi:hypothetical protein
MLTICQRHNTTGASVYGLPPQEPSDVTQGSLTYYRHMQDFDDRAAQAKLTCPRLAYIGSVDRPDLDGVVLTDMGGTVDRTRAELEALGWEVRIDPGKNHLDYTLDEMAAIIGDFLDRRLLRRVLD